MEQHMQALQRANEVRMARSALAREIEAGKSTVAELLDPERELPDFALAWPIGRLLRAQRRWGPTRARRFLVALGIRENRACGELTERQRRMICDSLAAREKAVPAAA